MGVLASKDFGSNVPSTSTANLPCVKLWFSRNINKLSGGLSKQISAPFKKTVSIVRIFLKIKNYDDFWVISCQQSSPQPIISKVPPIGVTAPSHLGKPIAIRYSEPLKMIMPSTRQNATDFLHQPNAISTDTSIIPKALMSKYWVAVCHHANAFGNKVGSVHFGRACAPNAPSIIPKNNSNADTKSQRLGKMGGVMVGIIVFALIAK